MAMTVFIVVNSGAANELWQGTISRQNQPSWLRFDPPRLHRSVASLSGRAAPASFWFGGSRVGGSSRHHDGRAILANLGFEAVVALGGIWFAGGHQALGALLPAKQTETDPLEPAGNGKLILQL